MMSRIFLASGATVAATAETGAMDTIKNVLLIVFLVVAVVWLLIDARRNLITTYGGASAPPPVPQMATVAAAPARNSAVAGHLAPEVLAVLAAAVHATLGRSAHIVAISTDEDDAQTWAAEGRRAIYATRKVR